MTSAEAENAVAAAATEAAAPAQPASAAPWRSRIASASSLAEWIAAAVGATGGCGGGAMGVPSRPMVGGGGGGPCALELLRFVRLGCWITFDRHGCTCILQL